MRPFYGWQCKTKTNYAMKRIRSIFLGVLTLGCLSHPLFSQNLSGSYTVGNTTGTEDYSTISEAISGLRSGTIIGDVELEIGVGTYNEPIDLSSLQNGDFRVTLSGSSKEAVIVRPMNGIVADMSGISLLTTSNVTLENFTLEMDDISSIKVDYDGNGTKGINVENSSDIILEDLILSNGNFVAGEDTKEYIASAISVVSAEDITIRSLDIGGAGVLIFVDDYQNITIESSDFQKGQFHIRGEQEADTSADGLTIKGNTFLGPFPSGRSASAIYLFGHAPNFISSSYSSNLLIEDNFIDGLEADPNEGSYGIHLRVIDQPIIRNNIIHNGYDGIFDGGSTLSLIESNQIIGTASVGLRAQNLVGCNYINNIIASENTALTIVFSSNVRLVHNTLSASGDGTGIGLTGASGDSLVVVNNIFNVASTIQNELLLDFIKPAEVVIDHNLYSGNASLNTVKMVMWGGSRGPSFDAVTLEDWQTYQSEQDQNSLSSIPVFAGTDDYHITSKTDYRFGSFRSDVTKDFEDDVRDQSIGVDVGADQNCDGSCGNEVPSIALISPDGGPVGTFTTIFGSGFSSIASGNVVYFGAVQAEVVSSSSSELLVRVPYGATYSPVTVQVNGLIAESLSPFKVTFDSDGTIAQESLDASVTFGTGVEASATATGDLDGDGYADIVVANSTDNSISILRNVSTGVGDINFEEKVDFAAAGYCTDVLLADFDGDGRLDIGVGHSDNTNISIFHNSSNGSLSFEPRQDIAVGSFSYAIASGDLDLDGRIDLIITDKENDAVTLLKNQSLSGAISFSVFNSFTTGDSPISIAITDVDQDGIKDVVTANQSDLSISVLLNDGAMNLANKQDFQIGSEPTQVIAGDLDGDGIDDLVATSIMTPLIPVATIKLFRNTSAPGSISLAASDLSLGASRISLSDINGDGSTDILYTDLYNGLYMIKNISTPGTLSFEADVNIIPEVWPFSVSAGDLDHDGEPDIILSGLTQDFQDVVEVFRNLGSGAIFKEFSVPEQSAPAIIDEENHTVDISLVDCTDVGSLTASFKAPGASVEVLGAAGAIVQTSGVTTNDFSLPLTYVLSSEDGASVQNWLVTASGNSYADEVTMNVEVCDSYLFDGQTLTASGQYQALFTNHQGCDSLVNLNLTIQADDIDLDVIACDQFEFDGATLTESGQYEGLFTNVHGCDSLVTLNLTIESEEVVEEVTACDFYVFDGETLTESGQYMATFTKATGCDSLVTLNLTVNQSDETIEDIEACESFEFAGEDLTVSGQYQELFTNMHGCDSLVTLNLTIYESEEIEVDVEACDSFDFDGMELSSSGQYNGIFSNVHGL